MSDKPRRGGRRAGAGRPQSLPHKPNIIGGEDMNPRKTYTFYGAKDEVPAVRHFLKVWRKLRFETDNRTEKLMHCKGLFIYNLLTGEPLAKLDELRLKNNLPEVYGIYQEYLESKTDNQVEKIDFKTDNQGECSTMKDYEKHIREEARSQIERLVILKKVCEESGIALQDYLLAGIADDLEKIRVLQENE